MTLTGELAFDTAFPGPFMMMLSIHCVVSSTITFDWFSVRSYTNIQEFQQYECQHSKKCLGCNSNRVLRDFILCTVETFLVLVSLCFSFLSFFFSLSLFLYMCILPFAITKGLR